MSVLYQLPETSKIRVKEVIFGHADVILPKFTQNYRIQELALAL